MIEQVFTRDRSEAFRRTAGLRSVGRVAVKHGPCHHLGQLARILEADLQAVDRPFALAFEFRRRIIGAADHRGQDLARRFHIGYGGRQAEKASVRARRRPDARAETFEPGGDLLRAHSARALVGERCRKVGDAGLGALIRFRPARHENGHGGERHISRLCGDHLYSVVQGLLDDLGSFDGRFHARFGQRIAFRFRADGERGTSRLGQGAEGRERGRVGPFAGILLTLLVSHVHPASRVEPFRGRALDIRDGHGGNGGEPLVRCIGIAGGDQRLAHFERPATRGLALAKRSREDLVLGLRQFGCADRGDPHPLDFCIENRLDLFGIGGGIDDREARDHAGLLAVAIEEAGIDSLSAAHQSLVEAAVVAARHDRREHLERSGILTRGLWTLPQRTAHRQRHVGRAGNDRARTGALRLFGAQFERQRILAARNIGEIFVHHCAQIGHFEITGDDQRSGIRPVIGFVKRQRIFQRCRVELLDRPDPGTAIGGSIVSVLGQNEALEASIGRRKHALAQFLLHHVAFAIEDLVVDNREGHPFPMRPQHPLEIFGRHGFEVIGPVGPVRSIARAPDIGGEAVNLIIGHIHGLAAQDVLEQMREAASSFGIELGADIVPHRGGDAGGGIILDCDHAQAVVECPHRIVDFGRGDGGVGRTLGKERHGGAQGDGGGRGGKKPMEHDEAFPRMKADAQRLMGSPPGAIGLLYKRTTAPCAYRGPAAAARRICLPEP